MASARKSKAQLTLDFTPKPKKPVVWTIYRHVHRPSQKCYVGLTSRSASWRWNQHVSAAKTKKRGGCGLFNRAIRKHGRDAFEHDVLETVDTLDAANEAEQWWIAHFGCDDPALGYNLSAGGHANSMSEATKEKLRHAQSTESRSANTKKANAARSPEDWCAAMDKRRASRTPEEWAETARKNRSVVSTEDRRASALAMWSARTPEHRSAMAADRESRLTPAQRSAKTAKGWATRRANAAANNNAEQPTLRTLNLIRVNLLAADNRVDARVGAKCWATRRANAARRLAETASKKDAA